MPLIAQFGVVVPDPPVEPPPPPKPPRVVTFPYVTWTPNGGTEYELVNPLGGLVVMQGVRGVDMPPEEQHETEMVADGSMLTHRRAQAREVMLPVRLGFTTSSDESELLRRRLVRLFDPRRGPGVLRWSQTDGSTRYLRAIYHHGLESADAGHRGARRHATYQVILRARDPYWFGVQSQVTFDPPVSGEFFAPPGSEHVVFISSSQTTGDRDVEIDGEVEVWPVWEIDGPCTTAVLRNRDTGQTLNLTPNLALGQTLIVRTDPRTPPREKITLAGANVWASRAGQFPVMWSLRPGVNRVTVTLNGTVSGQSQGRLIYTPRYLSA